MPAAASDISTQPDDSLGLRERLQQEIRTRILAQEALAALQAERNELLRRLEQSQRGKGAADTHHEGAITDRPEGPADTPSEGLADNPSEAAASSSLEDVREAAEESKGVADKKAEGGEKRAEGAHTPPEMMDCNRAEATEADRDAGESRDTIRDTGAGSSGPKLESNQNGDLGKSPNELGTLKGSPESMTGTEAAVNGEGGQVPPDAQAGPSRGPKAEFGAVITEGKDSVVAEGGLKEALAKKDSEIARLKEKLVYWDRVNEEYRIQREEAKGKRSCVRMFRSLTLFCYWNPVVDHGSQSYLRIAYETSILHHRYWE